MPLLLQDAAKFALRAQKRQRSEDSGTAVYPVVLNDDSYDVQLVPSGSLDVRVAADPVTFGDREGVYTMYLTVTQTLYEQLLKLETECSQLLAEKHPGAGDCGELRSCGEAALLRNWHSALRPPTDTYSATLKVKFYGDVQVYDEGGEKTEAPKSWRNLRVVPILGVKAWANEKGAGLWFTLAAAKVAKPTPRAYAFV